MTTWIRKDGQFTRKIERKSDNLRVSAITGPMPGPKKEDVAPARIRESNVRPFRQQAPSFQSSVHHYDPRSRKFPIAA